MVSEDEEHFTDSRANLGVDFIGSTDGLDVGGIRDVSQFSGLGHLLRW